MGTGIIIQARCSSTRLPKKVMSDINGKPLLLHVLNRVMRNNKTKNIIVATTTRQDDDAIETLAKGQRVPCFRGSEHDVLARYIAACERYDMDKCVRITADCPLIDPEVINTVIAYFDKGPADYIFIGGYPRGIGDVEFVTLEALRKAKEMTKETDTYYREHVITYMMENPDIFKLRILDAPKEFVRAGYRLCVDEIDDLRLVRKIYSHFSPKEDFGTKDILEYLDRNPAIAKINQNVGQKNR